MCAIDENIEMPAQFTVRIYQVELYSGVFVDNFFNQLAGSGGRDGKLGLIVDVIFHDRRKADGRHKGIVIQWTSKHVYR